ncbi:hypothetical protein NW767_015330, partial [Fusarium falciforme]
ATSTKQSPPGSEAGVGTDTTPAVSPARIEGDPGIDPTADPEPNQQPLCQSNSSSAGGFSACIDASLDLSSASPENQLYPVMSDRQQLVTAFTRPASEPGITTIDALSDEGSCRGGQSSPTSPSASTHSTIAATPGEMAHALLHSSKVCAGTSPDDATLGARNSSLAARISPEPHRGQDLDDANCGSCDAESEAADGEPGSPFRTQAPPQLPSPRRSRRISPHAHATAQEENNDVDTEGSGSEDGLDDPRRVHGEDYCPRSSTTQGPSSGDDSDGEEQHGHKRRKVSRSRHTSVHNTPASIQSSPQSWSTRRTAQPPRGRRTSAYGIESPTSSQARPAPSETSTFHGRFEEWPLKDVLLKRITEGDKTTFQLQFEWPLYTNHPQATSAIPDSIPSVTTKKQTKRAPARRAKYTDDEDNFLVQLKGEEQLEWAEIRRRFAQRFSERGLSGLQAHYCTKLKDRGRT